MPSSQTPAFSLNVTDAPWDLASDFPSSVPAWGSMANSVLKIALISVIVCVSLFGNVVVLLVFQRKPQLLHVANRFVLNLLLADLLQTVLVMPFAIAATVPGVWPLDARLCQALVVLMHLFAFAGVNTIIVVSVDRYLAIIHPLSYPTRMTPHLGTNLIICTWVLSFLQSTPPLYGWGSIDFNHRHKMCSVVWSYSVSYSLVVATFSFWLPVLVMLGCYWMVFRAARRQNALVHPIQTRSYSQPRPQDFPGQMGSPPRQASSPDGPSSGKGYPTRCCLHPYIYGYMHRSVRKEFLALLCGMFCKRGRSSAAETCLTAAGEARAGANPHLPSLAARVFPLQTWEECTTSSSPTFERRSRDSRKETTMTSVSSEQEPAVHGKQSA
ncbi:putative G-protein coupled receptor 101 isoform X2 [Vanacampus margaritifer]